MESILHNVFIVKLSRDIHRFELYIYTFVIKQTMIIVKKLFSFTKITEKLNFKTKYSQTIYTISVKPGGLEISNLVV